MASKFFDYLTNLYEKQEPIDLDFKEHFNIRRYLALHPKAFWAAADCNVLAKLPIWAINYTLWYCVPKLKKAPWKKYIKAEPKAKVSDKHKTAVDRVSYIFNCSTYHAEQTLTLLEKQGFNIQ